MDDGASGESEAVLAFMREQGAAVLRRAIADVESCPAERLPEVAHAWKGTLGSYQLDAAHDLVAELQDVVRDPDTTPDEATAARARTVAGLLALEATSEGDTGR
jgi:hypothetical protein